MTGRPSIGSGKLSLIAQPVTVAAPATVSATAPVMGAGHDAEFHTEFKLCVLRSLMNQKDFITYGHYGRGEVIAPDRH